MRILTSLAVLGMLIAILAIGCSSSSEKGVNGVPPAPTNKESDVKKTAPPVRAAPKK